MLAEEKTSHFSAKDFRCCLDWSIFKSSFPIKAAEPAAWLSKSQSALVRGLAMTVHRYGLSTTSIQARVDIPLSAWTSDGRCTAEEAFVIPVLNSSCAFIGASPLKPLSFSPPFVYYG
jgi:hypothetical protein